MDTSTFFGQRPSTFVRAGSAAAGIAALTIGIWGFAAEPGFYAGVQWLGMLSHVCYVLIGLAFVAQAAAPVRFFWPGWVVVLGVVLPVGGASLLSSIASYDQLPAFFSASTKFQWFVLPVLFWTTLAVALLAWHLQPRQTPAPLSGPAMADAPYGSSST